MILMSSVQGPAITTTTLGGQIALDVNIIGGGGGGGQQYADGAARGTATGTLMMVDDGSNIQSAKGDSQGTLFVKAQLQDDAGTSITTGQKTMGLSIPVVIASNQSQLAVTPGSGFWDNASIIGTISAGIALNVTAMGISDGANMRVAKGDTSGNIFIKAISQATTLLDSNTTLFTPGGSFTGAWFQVMGVYSALNVASFINVSGFGGATRYASVNIDFSSNGSSADGDIVTINVGFTDGNPARVAVPVVDNFARLRILEVGGYDWSAAGGSARTVLTGVPVGSGSYVRTVGTTVVAGDGSGVSSSPINIGADDGAGNSVLLVADATVGALKIIGAGGTNITNANILLTAERGGSTGTLTNTSVAASSTTLASSSTSRRGMVVHNDSSEILYLKYGTSASSTSYTFKVEPGAHWFMHMPLYTGTVTGIAPVASGTWRVTTW